MQESKKRWLSKSNKLKSKSKMMHDSFVSQALKNLQVSENIIWLASRPAFTSIRDINVIKNQDW